MTESTSTPQKRIRKAAGGQTAAAATEVDKPMCTRSAASKKQNSAMCPTPTDANVDDLALIAACRADMTRAEVTAAAAGLQIAWIDPEPTLSGDFEAYWLLSPPPPGEMREIALGMPGHAQVLIFDSIGPLGRWGAGFTATAILDRRQYCIVGALHICGDGVGHHYSAEFLAASRDFPPAGLSQIARLLRYCGGNRLNFSALLDGTRGCSLCGALPAGPLARDLGFCAGCADLLKVPFTRETLAAVTVRREFWYGPKGDADHAH